MVDRNNPSDNQWWAMLRLVEGDEELLLCQYTNKGAQVRVQEKWAAIAVELNALKTGSCGCVKPADGWRISWNSMKSRARKAAGNPNRKQRNALFDKVYELVGPLVESSGDQGQQAGEENEQQVPPLVEGPAVEGPVDVDDTDDFLWAGLADPAVVTLDHPLHPVAEVKQEINDKDEVGATQHPPVITIDDTPIKTPSVKREKQLHTPPSGAGAIPKRRLKYEPDVGAARPSGGEAELSDLMKAIGASHLIGEETKLQDLTKAINDNTSTMLKLIKKLDNVSLLPL